MIIDWDQQPEAGMVLHAAQDRKVTERPLTLAVVSDDGSAPKALQAGANSTLRKPLVVNQVTDTLKTARDLLGSRFAQIKPQAAAAASTGAPSALPASMEAAQEKSLRAGEFLQSAPLNPGGQIVSETESPVSLDQSIAEPVDALKELEPVAAAAPPSPPPVTDEPKGLEWHLKRKGLQSAYRGAAAAPASAPNPPRNNKPELLGYDQTPSFSETQRPSIQGSVKPPTPHAVQDESEGKQEAALFSYIAGESEVSHESSPSRFRLGKGAIIAASVLAAVAIVAAPQAPWHSRLKIVGANAQHSLHKWLNPQPVTAVSQAPASHEDFGRAGDEYKLPAAETIPDATTDPSQIQVLPAVDPTAKKATTDAAAPDQNQSPTDTNAASTPEASQTPSGQVQENPPAVQPPPAATSPAPLATPTSAPTTNTVATALSPSNPPHSEQPTVLTNPAPSNPAPTAPLPRRQPSEYVPPTTKVPSSLQSQMVTMVPDASGNKSPDAAMPAIEPVAVAELTERALITNQPPINYPASARGQQGTVILQVLIGRDGAVQDAKFVQGSLAFARPAIDGVKQWKFKPYIMNGRAVSVQTSLTIKFKPAQ
ncbi:MAG TPA: TonB family protein [Candidatus Eisenbacteria bacterium]|nr:TonB family protein [Candidatus Eisenbacteria bacterium]